MWKRNPEDNRRHVKEFRVRMRDFVRSLKASACMDCRVFYPHYKMHFDHVRGVKKFNISTVSVRFVAKERVLNEIAKCDLVCANCHAERTWNRLAKD